MSYASSQLQQPMERQDCFSSLGAECTADLQAANRRLRREIVKRLRIERELKESKQKLREVLQGSPIAQFVLDTDHRVVFWNRAMERITGVAANRIVGTRDHWMPFYNVKRPCLVDLLIDGEQSEIAAIYQDKCSRSSVIEDAYEAVDFFSTIGERGKWLHGTAAVLKDARGRTIGGVETLEDITTRRLAEIQVANSREAAEAANWAKSAFLANMSHEIRTPMTAIMGYLELLAEGCVQKCPFPDAEAGNPLDVVFQNAKHLLQLIDDVLDLSKIEMGKLQIERTTCSPCQIVADVAALMRVRTGVKGLTLEVAYANTMPETIESDPRRLRQILINVVGNAVKFTETGGVRVLVDLDRASAEPFLRIQVVDTGIGMSQETLQGVFAPFTQADASTSRRFSGTGLGLTISKRLAQLLGGDIAVDSVLGKGSAFTLTVPTGPLDHVAMIDHPADVRPAAAEDGSDDLAFGDQPLDGRRVLLAEDGPDNQRFISLVLKRAGAEVSIASNGQLAVDLAMAAGDQGTPYDAILMDMQMPILDGYRASRKLRTLAWTGPIIALTAHALADDRQKCLDAGCSDYLTKPIDRKLLVSRLARHIQNHTPRCSQPSLC